MLPRCLFNTGYLSPVCKLSKAYPAYTIFSEISMRSSAYPASAVFPCGKLCRACLLNLHCSFCHTTLLLILEKWHIKQCQKLTCFFIGFSGGNKYNIHSSHFIYLIIFYLRKYQLLLDAKGIISSAVK